LTDWFARPVLHVTDVDASIRFYVDLLGFSSPWRFEEDGKTFVAQVERQGCALILSSQWPEKVGKGLMFISLNVDRRPTRPRSRPSMRCGLNSKPRALRSRTAGGATGSWWSMIPTAISCSSTIRTRLHPARLLQMKRNRPAAPSWPGPASPESAGHSREHGIQPPDTFSLACVAGQKRGQGLLSERPGLWAFREVRSAWLPSILFGHARVSIPYAASRRAPVRASVAR
jgi:hypothetical protein